MLSPNPFLTTADTAVELDHLDLFKPPAAVMRRDALHQGTGAAYVPQLILIRALQFPQQLTPQSPLAGLGIDFRSK
jgi:hypothetical protein